MPKMMRMPTVRKGLHRFDNVPSIRGPRSVFNYSHPHKTTFDASLLVPVLIEEVLPGDTWAARLQGFGRLSSSALQRPIMDNLYWDTFWFFCPMRLLWSNAPKFFGEQVNPGDSISYVIPSLAVPFTLTESSLSDYFGVMAALAAPRAIETPNAVNVLPYRMYNLMYNQWFRDQNLINSRTVPVGDGPDALTLFTLQKSAKRPDYFTSALPFLQKGAVTSVAVSPVTANAVPTFWNVTGGAALNALKVPATSGTVNVQTVNPSATASDIGWLNPNLQILINDLRQSVMIQEFLERDARGGTRYPELVYEHFGVENPDSRVQYVEYLGGGSSPIIVSPIAQTGQTGLTGGATPLGNLAGSGSVFIDRHGFHKSFTEHGYLMCIARVRGDVTYQQGLHKRWTRSTRFDFYWREFAHLGEQAILNKEIYWVGTTALTGQDNTVFGYIPRYEDYRFAFGRVSGKFRSQDPTPLDNWHLAQEFAAVPTLGQTFIEDDTTTILGSRILAVSTEPDILADLWFDIKVARPIPVYGVPGFAKRF